MSARDVNSERHVRVRFEYTSYISNARPHPREARAAAHLAPMRAGPLVALPELDDEATPLTTRDARDEMRLVRDEDEAIAAVEVVRANAAVRLRRLERAAFKLSFL